MSESPNDVFDQVYPGRSIEDGKEVVVSVKSGSPVLDDGVKSRNYDFVVKDIAQIVLESL